MRNRICRNLGFSLIELLVVIAIIGVLVGLLMPAVQQARAAAQRAASESNLKQMGIALQTYHEVHSRFPAGYWSNPNSPLTNPTSLDGPSGFAWGAQLLPYLEQSAISESFNFDLPCWGPANSTAAMARLAVFINPGAPNQEGLFDVKDGSGVTLARFAISHYVGNVGQDEPWGHVPAVADWSRIASGPLYRNSQVRIADVTDGLGKSVFVGEHTTISHKTWVGVVPGADVCPIDPLRFPFTSCDGAATLVLAHSGPAASEPGVVHAPGFPTCHVCQMYSPWHGGLVLLGDGSVQFVSNTCDLNIWAALNTIRGEEIKHEF